jgi:hypothetical protein
MSIPASPVGCAALAAVLVTLLWPVAAQANSRMIVNNGGGPITARARLLFGVNVEEFLYLRVGTGTAMANNTTVDSVGFAVTSANNGSGTAVAAASTVTAQVRGNGGNISFSNSTPGSLSNGAQSVSYATISATAAALAGSPTLLNHPAFVNGASSAASSLVAVGRVVHAGATWTFRYANATVLNSGVYGATVARNARVTYTAVMP